MSKAIGERLVDSKSTQHQIEESRECYRPVAARGSLLYFIVSELCKVDVMYQYSLDFFQVRVTNLTKKMHHHSRFEQMVALSGTVTSQSVVDTIGWTAS